jgi:multiple antibiotic resistance protein
MSSLEQPLKMIAALFALSRPLASVSSYFPVVSKLGPADQTRLAPIVRIVALSTARVRE